MDSASRAGAATVGANSPVAMLPSNTQRLLYVGQLPANRLVGIPATDPKRKHAFRSWHPRRSHSSTRLRFGASAARVLTVASQTHGDHGGVQGRKLDELFGVGMATDDARRLP